MKFFIASVFLITIFPYCEAQNITSFQGEQIVQDIRGSEVVIRSFDTRYEGIKGLPFLFSEWTTFEIVDAGNGYELESMFDANESKVLYKVNDRLFEKSLTDLDDLYLILGNMRISVIYLNKYKTGLFIESDRQEYQGYRIEVVKQLRKANYKGAYNQGRPFDEYITQVQVMICDKKQENCRKLKGKAYSKLGVSKKDIRDILNEGNLKRFEELVRELMAP